MENKIYPLIARLRNGGVLFFNDEVKIKENGMEIDGESVVKIATNLFRHGINIISLDVDTLRM